MCKNLDGENLVDFWSIINFAKFKQRQSFPPYSITASTESLKFRKASIRKQAPKPSQIITEINGYVDMR